MKFQVGQGLAAGARKVRAERKSVSFHVQKGAEEMEESDIFSGLRHGSVEAASTQLALTVLAATEELIDEQGQQRSPIMYASVLIALLEGSSGAGSGSPDPTGRLAATCYLLSLVYSRIPHAAQQQMFERASSAVLACMKLHGEHEVVMLKQALTCLSYALNGLDVAAWKQETPTKVFIVLMQYALDKRQKVRRRAHESVSLCVKAFKSELSSTVTDFATKILEASLKRYGQGSMKQVDVEVQRAQAEEHGTVSMRVTALLKMVGPKLKSSHSCALSTVFEDLLQFSTFAPLKAVVWDCLQGWLSSVELRWSFAFTLELLGRLQEFAPPQELSQRLCWMQTMTAACKFLSKLADSDDEIVRYVSVFVRGFGASFQGLLDDRTEVIHACANGCVKMLEFAPLVGDCGEEITAIVIRGLSYAFHAAWDSVLMVCAALFQRYPTHPGSISLLQQLAGMRSWDSFTQRAALDEALKVAIGSMKVGAFLEVLPLNLLGEVAQESRPWLLPLLQDGIAEDSLLYFHGAIFPLAQMVESTHYRLMSEGAEADAANAFALYSQLWQLFPSFCRECMDLEKALPFLEEVLKEKLEGGDLIRLHVCAGLMILLTEATERGLKGGIFNSMANSLFPVLFDLIYDEATSPSHQLSLLSVTAALVPVCDGSVSLATFRRILKRLISYFPKAEFPSLGESQRCASLAVAAAFVPELGEESLSQLMEVVGALAKNPHISIPCEKRILRLLHVILTEHPNFFTLDVVRRNWLAYLVHVPGTNSTTSASSKKWKLRCIAALLNSPIIDWEQLIQDSPSLLSLLALEATLSLKENNARARNAALDCLRALCNVAIGNSYVLVSTLAAGLASATPYMTSATVQALAFVLSLSGTHALEEEQFALLLSAILPLADSESVEIVKSVFAFARVVVHVLSLPELLAILPSLLTHLFATATHAKSKLRHSVAVLLERLIRKCGEDPVSDAIPPAYIKVLSNIRKALHRKHRKQSGDSDMVSSKDKEKEKEKEKEKNSRYPAASAVEEMDSSDEEDALTASVMGAKSSVRQVRHTLQETGHGDEPMDLLDPTASKSVRFSSSGTKGNKRNVFEKAFASSGQEAEEETPFEVDAEGRWIIEDDDSDSEESGSEDDARSAAFTFKSGRTQKTIKTTKTRSTAKTGRSAISDQKLRKSLGSALGGLVSAALDAEDVAFEKREKLGGPGRGKRNKDALDHEDMSEDEGHDAMPAGGKERKTGSSWKVSRESKKPKKPNQEQMGDRYRGKGAGDVLRKDAVEPYAYLPLDRSALGKKKRPAVNGLSRIVRTKKAGMEKSGGRDRYRGKKNQK
jgi:hypothetical protein